MALQGEKFSQIQEALIDAFRSVSAGDLKREDGQIFDIYSHLIHDSYTQLTLYYGLTIK